MNIADIPDSVWGALVGVAGTLIVFALNRLVKRRDDRKTQATQLAAETRARDSTIEEEVRKAALELIAWDIERRNRVESGTADALSRPPPQEVATLTSHGSQRMASAIQAEEQFWSSSTAQQRAQAELIDRLLDVRAELIEAARQEIANVGAKVDSR